ncbi:hypothetical protein [Methylobacterium durans]|jgi:hypothetical protein|uniref:Uncharacterized protein n=1 Tax=Methylobacterium durans TaxID=2202825 RepID=A0A2U8W191_9HYPH|nr:hypothetical protein [Methylobacterium durans]AWN39854.1 hypothetical protein DK389_04020 [Methylobacterium durans]
MGRIKDGSRTVRLIKRRRTRPAKALTFRDLHAAERDGKGSQERGTSGGGFPSASDAIAKPARQGGSEVVINHVLV